MKIFRDRKPLSVLGWVYPAIAIIAIAGCSTQPTPMLSKADSSVDRVSISAITEFVQGSEGPQIKTLVEFSSASDLAVKTPCTFRFELYEFQPVSSDPRGRRVVIWPTIDLNDPHMIERHWKDFLRGYEFFLPLEFTPRQGGKYVLEVTCFVDQKRHSDLYKMQYL